MKSAQIRQKFLDYFAHNGHEVVASSPLVPGNDPTLLFTNAGMVQFKDVFLGSDQRSYRRAATSQRCVRAGGKHNDLENVGYTARHHTFFEMLGNFSFGDYFKERAIHFAWDFLTLELGLPKEKLWVTVYEGDDEAADIWLNTIGVDVQRFSRLGKKDNFWSMGDVGPCGPCSEIFYDHGPEVPGGPPGSPEEDGDRYIEIWNLVFMQYDSAADGSVTPLPKPSVDTGMGLERISAVMQGVHNNYDIDLFVNLLNGVSKITGFDDTRHASMRVIADHIRACAFLITDGVLPSNEGRGYVLRRIIRRAIRHGHKLGVKKAFFHRLVGPLNQQMGSAYPELTQSLDHIETILLKEEQRFSETLDQGMLILNKVIKANEGGEIPGNVAFKLYDTYGFPFDLTADVARERSMTVDKSGFDRAMQSQKKLGKATSRFSAHIHTGLQYSEPTEFTGYDGLYDDGKVVTVVIDDREVEKIGKGQNGILILDRSPFYAESGGQVGDTGVLKMGKAIFEVNDTQKLGEAIGHIGEMVAGEIKIGDQLKACVSDPNRAATMRNHSATHLLHAALRTVLGDHVVQKGSLVDAERLRFDFSHYDALTDGELNRIEDLVNEEILSNHKVGTEIMSFDTALESGAIALFGEKYDMDVRVLSMGDFSRELCGGTHVARTGDIGFFKVTSESGVAAGVRRVEAVTANQALLWVRNVDEQLKQIAHMVKSNRVDLLAKVDALSSRNRNLEKDIAQLKKQIATGGSSDQDLMSKVIQVDNINVLSARLDGLDISGLREAVDQFKDKLGSAVVVFGAVEGDKVRLVAGVSKDCTSQIKAGELVSQIAEIVDGRGGGRSDMAQAGGNNPAKLDLALDAVVHKIKEKL